MCYELESYVADADSVDVIVVEVISFIEMKLQDLYENC